MAGTTAPVEVEPDLDQAGNDAAAAIADSEVRKSARGFIVTTAAVVLVAVAALVVGGISWTNLRAEQTAQSRDQQVLETARQVVVNLVTLRHQSVDEDIQRVADGTTGPFRDQFTSASGSFGDVLNQGQVESTGEVKEAGLVKADDDHAVVLAAVTSTVKNTEAPDGEIRVYRMKVSLDSVDGRWLVSDVEFVA
ncbi:MULTISPECIES: hypothetical protein [Rhodococcus]|uniref:Mce-associated membrane protein n=2 Tax=Rhodococcus TaxID=1827 RepID=I0WL20_RHOOP|nr:MULTISPECIES: hypothetical protein [Rhodococcus]EID77086.1 hypothetical protein W59_26216 [Rhodococcus opacus RKJ300 = JCM 13270]MBV6755129.1 hypothetical protein [Rhodococcus opacus]QQZ18755.1 hypothetical protein GO592_35035 [Rhodococcus sp. 21391]QSE92702.1 hypothetical protein JWS13_30890 [Rhodococcus pseudokoreensis]